MASLSSLEGKRAAIIEDEGVTQMLLRRTLTRSGVQVVGSAANAQDGIDLVLKERPDLVLMDITMPGKLNGLDAAEAILPVYQPCLVVVSAYNNDEYRLRAEKLGVCGYLVKPVTSQSLMPALEAFYTTWTHNQA